MSGNWRLSAGCISASSPSKAQADEPSVSAIDETKEKEDCEILHIFDGNSSLRKHVYRTAVVPKTAGVQQIRVSFVDFCKRRLC